MLYDPDIEEAIRYIEEAQRRLYGGESSGNGAGLSPCEAALDRLNAAGQELRALRSAEHPNLSQITGAEEPSTPVPMRASQVLGLLSLLRFQLDETERQVEPLAPDSDPTAPLRRLEEADLEGILASLACLRRLASAMEVELRPLKQERGGNEPRKN